MWEGVSHSGKVCPQCGKVFPNVGGCVPFWKGVPQCGGCPPVWEGLPQCGRVCPCMCVCEVWVSLSHVVMADTQVHLCVHLIAGRFSHLVKAPSP